LNPRVDTHTGSQGQTYVESDHTSYPLELLKYAEEYENMRGAVGRIIVEGNKVIIEFEDPDKSAKLIEFLRSLGVTATVEKKELKIEYDERFKEYLLKDRQIDERTARDYMNYLKKLAGKVIDYNLYLEIVDNKWKVKLVRIYLDYLFKTNKISWEEKERLKSIFKVKKNNDSGDEYKIDAENLVERAVTMREGLYRLILELLLYSGARLSEAVKMLREWDESRLECFGEICRYRLRWLRGRKRCDYIFFSRRLLDRIMKYVHKIGKYETIRKDIYDEYGIRTKDFRKLHYRLCRTILDKEICSFYQSRVANLDVSDRHYDELLTRATESYHSVVKKIEGVIDNVLSVMADGIPVEKVEVVGWSADDEKETSFPLASYRS